MFFLGWLGLFKILPYPQMFLPFIWSLDMVSYFSIFHVIILTGPGDSKDLQKGGAQNALVVGPSMPSTAA
jgi:hypothetical protein